MKKTLTKICPVCKTVFSKGQNCSLRAWREMSKFCSRECSNIGRDSSLRAKQMSENNPMKLAHNRKKHQK